MPARVFSCPVPGADAGSRGTGLSRRSRGRRVLTLEAATAHCSLIVWTTRSIHAADSPKNELVTQPVTAHQPPVVAGGEHQPLSWRSKKGLYKRPTIARSYASCGPRTGARNAPRCAPVWRAERFHPALVILTPVLDLRRRQVELPAGLSYAALPWMMLNRKRLQSTGAARL